MQLKFLKSIFCILLIENYLTLFGLFWFLKKIVKLQKS